MCTAWLRGPDRTAGMKMAEQSKPFCIQVGKMNAIDQVFARGIHAAERLLDVNYAPDISKILQGRLTTGKLCLEALARCGGVRDAHGRSTLLEPTVSRNSGSSSHASHSERGFDIVHTSFSLGE